MPKGNDMAKDEFTKIEGNHDLSTCPFCGSQAELWEFQPNSNTYLKAAMCSNGGDDYHEGECPMYLPNEGFYKSTKREAIQIWNTRNPK